MIRKLCAIRGCDELAVPGGSHCAVHAAEKANRLAARRAQAKTSDAARKGHALYRTSAWRKAAKAYLAWNPLCVDCGQLGGVEPAVEVDHIERHRGDPAKFWDRSNWQPLCRRCHSRKTAREVFHGA
ncbi:HNH endonuclease [Mesobaculum littorinae]|uniref:Putative HNH nuclease YajD n=1 Tax=Mesobaculum littorinae TaxID=2486419 RepID=A0A438AM32_9RHOB|nr:HNH endonuclease signature motif containing protein [Mesobaculum littorinae]RVV99714.1 HNH endonuclease [Mesobaculum littorinae]